MPISYTKPKGHDRNGNPRFEPDPKKYLYNVDTFWFNVGADNYQDVLNNGLRDLLIEGRNYIMDTDEPMYIEVHLDYYENPLVFEILPGQPPLYQYSIRNSDLAIYFSKNARIDQLPMKVQLNQFILWEKGVLAAYKEALDILNSLGFILNQKKLNRVDFAVHSDQYQWILDDLKSFDYPRNIAQDNFPNFWRLDPLTGNFETVYFGSRSTCQLRIYNKSIEAKKKKKEYFLDLYESLGMDKDKVWNIEIEVRRDFIKECKSLDGLRLFDDLDVVFEEGRLSLLWSHLMKMYAHNSAHWTRVSKGKKNVFEKSKGYLKREKDNVANAYRETAQIRGRLMNFVLNDKNYSLENAILKFIEMNKEYEEYTTKEWTDQVEKKKLKFHNVDINSTVKNSNKNEKDAF
ncbi:replication initiation protein [Bacillus sp. FSL L8-0287]|uniref:replication initiation protein n=1 Tax=Bacillus sp. FSL L8-0287 TaxID=2976835 RepID=UPI0030F7CD23